MNKEKLQRYGAIVKERQQLEEMLEEIETRLYSPKAQQLTGMPSAPSRNGSTLETAVVENSEDLEELREHYARLIESLAAEQLAIEKAIEALEPVARTLLRYRYIEGRKWEEICVLLNYSWRQTHRLHAAALIELKGEKHDNPATD